LLSEYFGRASFRQAYFTDPYDRSVDGWSEYEQGKDIDAPWMLVPIVGDELAEILVANLPTQSGLSGERSKEFLLSLKPRVLNQILSRRENDLEDFRKYIFWEKVGEIDEFTARMAVSWNFNLTLEEFGKILAMPEEERFAKLDALTAANELKLVFYEAIRDHVLANESAAPSSLSDSVVYFLMDTACNRLSNLQGEDKEEQLRKLGLYILARRIATPGRMDLSDPAGWRETAKREPFFDLVCRLWDFEEPKDTWSTFLQLEKNWWDSSRWNWDEHLKKRLLKALPKSTRIYEEDDQGPREASINEVIEDRLYEFNKDVEEMIENRLDQLGKDVKDFREGLEKLQEEKTYRDEDSARPFHWPSFLKALPLLIAAPILAIYVPLKSGDDLLALAIGVGFLIVAIPWSIFQITLIVRDVMEDPKRLIEMEDRIGYALFWYLFVVSLIASIYVLIGFVVYMVEDRVLWSTVFLSPAVLIAPFSFFAAKVYGRRMEEKYADRGVAE
jgi:hypothetical protein